MIRSCPDARVSKEDCAGEQRKGVVHNTLEQKPSMSLIFQSIP